MDPACLPYPAAGLQTLSCPMSQIGSAPRWAGDGMARCMNSSTARQARARRRSSPAQRMARRMLGPTAVGIMGAPAALRLVPWARCGVGHQQFWPDLGSRPSMIQLKHPGVHGQDDLGQLHSPMRWSPAAQFADFGIRLRPVVSNFVICRAAIRRAWQRLPLSIPV